MKQISYNCNFPFTENLQGCFQLPHCHWLISNDTVSLGTMWTIRCWKRAFAFNEKICEICMPQITNEMRMWYRRCFRRWICWVRNWRWRWSCFARWMKGRLKEAGSTSLMIRPDDCVDANYAAISEGAKKSNAWSWAWVLLMHGIEEQTDNRTNKVNWWK